MQVASLVIALLALVVSTLALGWQVASFVLSGRRPTAFVSLGGGSSADPDTHLVFSLAAKGRKRVPAGGLVRVARSGSFDVPLVGVTVVNRGRMAMYVSGISFRWPDKSVWVPGEKVRFFWTELPCVLEPGQRESWLVDLRTLVGESRRGNRSVDMSVRAEVSLGDGTVLSPSETLQLSELPNEYRQLFELP